jgi:hypothetical protein
LGQHLSRFATLHAYTRSKMVSMGVAVANLAIGGIATVHTSQDRFDEALSAAVAAEAVSAQR